MITFKKLFKRIKHLSFNRYAKGFIKAEQFRHNDASSFAKYQVSAAGQRLQTGDRSEMCSNAMNNYQRLAALQMLKNSKDDL